MKGIDTDSLERAGDHPPLRIGGRASCVTCKHLSDGYCDLTAEMENEYPDYDKRVFMGNHEAPLDSIVCDGWESDGDRCGSCGR